MIDFDHFQQIDVLNALRWECYMRFLARNERI